MSGGAVGGGKRRLPEIDLVPILDAMTCVIFFLILSSVFVELTKVTLPPAQTSTLSSTDKKNPLSPKLFAVVRPEQKIAIALVWSGDSPNKKVKEIFRTDQKKRSKELEAATKELVSDFSREFPGEKSLQVGISPQGTYQELIAIMDGARASMQDLVLISPSEEALIKNRL